MEMNKFFLSNILICSLIFTLSSCSILPGMQSLNAASMTQEIYETSSKADPTVIPITIGLFSNKVTPNYIYRVAAQDVLNISIWQHPEFNLPIQVLDTSQTTKSSGYSGYLVDNNGTIFFPLLGTVPLAGKTINEVQKILTNKLKKFIRNPQVIVRVADFRSKKIYVFGEVNKPNILQLNDQPMTITDAIAYTGSFDQDASDTRHIYVIRGTLAKPRIYWLNANTPDQLLLAQQFQLQPNDIVFVSTAPVARWNRFINQLLPTLQTLYFTRTVTHN
jgi:protein involved in polysaccharide export with SLBB domain